MAARSGASALENIHQENQSKIRRDGGAVDDRNVSDGNREGRMEEQGIVINRWPRLKYPLLIAGFGGWANALNVSRGTVDFLIRMFRARPFASINPEPFYRYDQSRPTAFIQDGAIRRIAAPGGHFYAAPNPLGQNDLILLKAEEPAMRWYQFVDEMLNLCNRLGVQTIVTLGSLFDSVLPSDRVISAMATDEADFNRLKRENVRPISYQGPSAIHSLVQTHGAEKGFNCISLWSHCPYYLEEVVHFGMISAMTDLISAILEADLSIEGIDEKWEALETEINQTINSTPELQEIVREIYRSKRASETRENGKKVIQLTDFR